MSQSASRTELFASIGEALDAWSGAEMSIESIFAALNGTDLLRSHIIMASIINLETRLQICSNLIATTTGIADELRRVWNRAYNRITKLADKRNEIAHFSVMGRADGDLGIRPYISIGRSALIALQPQSKKYADKILRLADITNRKERFDELELALRWFSRELAVSLGTLEVNPVPMNDLVHRWMLPDDQTPEDM